jgi:hypothetical protein
VRVGSEVDSGELIYIGARLVLGAAAAALAITLWSRTRDGAWMFTALAVIASYFDVVYSILEMLGITKTIVYAGGIDVLKVIFSCIPALFFILAFSLFLSRRRRYKS